MPETTSDHLALLIPLFQASTQHASAAMRLWTHGKVRLSLEDVRQAPMEEIAANLDVGDDVMTMVVLQVRGLGGGYLILAFDESNGRELAAALLKRQPNHDPQWSDLEQSALMETGNLFGSAYLCELTRLTGSEFTPSPPRFVQDFGFSVLQQALITQAAVSDQVLICKTRFAFNDKNADWRMYFLPSAELLDRIQESINPPSDSTSCTINQNQNNREFR